MTPEEALKILGPFAKHVDIEASIIENDEDHENWLKQSGWKLAATGEELFDGLDLWDKSREEQRAAIDNLKASGRLDHAPANVIQFLTVRGLI